MVTLCMVCAGAGHVRCTWIQDSTGSGNAASECAAALRYAAAAISLHGCQSGQQMG